MRPASLAFALIISLLICSGCRKSASNTVATAETAPAIIDDAFKTADPKVQAIPDIAGFGAQVKNGVPLPNTPFMSALWDPVAKALEAVWTGKQSVDDALRDAQTAAEKNVAQLK